VAGQTAAEVARQQCASHVGWELAEHTLHTAQKYGQKILQLLELTLAQRIFANAAAVVLHSPDLFILQQIHGSTACHSCHVKIY
jgi:hypothetical protein